MAGVSETHCLEACPELNGERPVRSGPGLHPAVLCLKSGKCNAPLPAATLL